MKTGPLDEAIKRHKYYGAVGWAIIFARVVLGFLVQNRDVGAADAIIPMPSFSPSNDHAGRVIRSAVEQDDRHFPFRVGPPLIVKTAETTKMVGLSAAGRRAAATELYDSLTVINPAEVHGKFIVVFDDVFTGGNTLNAVARRLRDAGAAKVAGVTLARAPWR